MVNSHWLNVVKNVRSCFLTEKESGSERECMVLAGSHAVQSVVSFCL